MGVAEVAAREDLLEMERFGPTRENANASFVVHLVIAFEKVRHIVDWRLAMWFKFPQRVLRVVCGSLHMNTIRSEINPNDFGGFGII